jgi:hypothetical protein
MYLRVSCDYQNKEYLKHRHTFITIVKHLSRFLTTRFD